MKSVTEGGRLVYTSEKGSLYEFVGGTNVLIRNASQMSKSPGVQTGIDINSSNLNSKVGNSSTNIIKLKFK